VLTQDEQTRDELLLLIGYFLDLSHESEDEKREVVTIAQFSKAFLLKEMFSFNMQTINQSIKVITRISTSEFAEMSSIISEIVEDNRSLHVFSCILHKCNHVIRRSCLFLLSNAAVNSKSDAEKLLKHPELISEILKCFGPKTALKVRVEASHVLMRLFTTLGKHHCNEVLSSEEFIDDLVQTISVWKTSSTSQENMDLLQNALLIINLVLPSEGFDMRGGDSLLEDI
jgi:hypothetical protein